MNKVAVVLTIAIFGVIANNNSISESDDKQHNLFKEINDQIQNITNHIFFLLKLNRNFTGLEQTHLLLSMHVKVKNIANKNFEVYKNAIAESERYERDPRNCSFRLDLPLKEIFDEGLATINESRSTINETRVNETVQAKTDVIVTTRVEEIPVNIELEKSVNTIERSIPIIENLIKFNNTTIVVNYKKWNPTQSTELDFSKTRRLFQPKHVKIKKYPFVASVYVKGVFTCTGSVISRDMIITAASCLQELHKSLNETPDLVQVRIGSDFHDQEGELHSAIRHFSHPDYDIKTLNNNLAIIQMKKPFRVKKSNKKIRRIEYHRQDLKTPDELRKIVVLGWGDQNDEKANELSFTYLDIYNHADCQDIYTDKFVTEQNFCAGFITRGSGACMKDVGGPAVFSNVLVGIVSFGAPVCGTVDAPTVFTDIGLYIDWIDSTIKRKSSGQVIKLILPTTPQSSINLDVFHQPDQKNEENFSLSSNLNNEYVPVIAPAKKEALSDALQNVEIDFDEEDKFATTINEDYFRQSVVQGLDKKQKFKNRQHGANYYNKKPKGYVRDLFPVKQIRDTSLKTVESHEDIIYRPKTYQPKTSIKIDAAPLKLTTKLNQHNTSTASPQSNNTSIAQLLLYLFNNLFQKGNIANMINQLRIKNKPAIDFNIEPQGNKLNSDAITALKHLRNMQPKYTESTDINSQNWYGYATVTTPDSQIRIEKEDIPIPAKEGEKQKLINWLKFFLEKSGNTQLTAQDIDKFNAKEQELIFLKSTTPRVEFSRTFSSPNLLTYLLDEPIEINPGEQFLKNNFKKDLLGNSVPKKTESDEFILLLLQGTTKQPRDIDLMPRVKKHKIITKKSTKRTKIINNQDKLKRLKGNGRPNVPHKHKKNTQLQFRAQNFGSVKSPAHDFNDGLKMNNSENHYNELMEKINLIKLQEQKAFYESTILPGYSDEDAVIVLLNESVFTNDKNLSESPEKHGKDSVALRNIINITFTVDKNNKKLPDDSNDESSLSLEDNSSHENARRNIIDYLNL